MKFNQFISLIAVFLALAGAPEAQGMSLSHLKSYFFTSRLEAKNKLVQQLPELFKNSDFYEAKKTITKIFALSNPQDIDDWEKIIIDTFHSAIKNYGMTNLKEFIFQVIEPMVCKDASFNKRFIDAIQKEITVPTNKGIYAALVCLFSLDASSKNTIFQLLDTNIENHLKFLISQNNFLLAIDLFKGLSNYAPKDQSEKYKKQLLHFLFDNLSILNTSYEGMTDLNIIPGVLAIVGYAPFVDYLITHLDDLAKNHSSLLLTIFAGMRNFENDSESKQMNERFIETINNEVNIKKVTEAVQENLIYFIKNENGKLLIENDHISLLIKLPLADLIKKTIELINEAHPVLVENLLIRSQDVQLAQAIIASNRFSSDLCECAQEVQSGKLKHSPTKIHLRRNYKLAKALHTQFSQDSELNHLYNSFLLKEEELNTQEYYTFVHGQERRFYFPEKLYTHLWGLRKKRSVQNFFFAHVKDLVETEDAQFEEDILRKTIHMTGTQEDSDYPSEVDITRRKLVLFMNYAFFANATLPGSCSPHYVMINSNSALGKSTKLSIQEPFTINGYEWVYKKYENEIDQLALDSEKLSKYGNMLLIAIPKKSIYKHVYLTKSGGIKQSVFIDGKREHDIRIIMETLINNPEKISNTDRLEFCLIMTQVKGGLDPATGIQVHPLLSGDPEKLKVLQQREDALLAKITADIQEHEKQHQLTRAAVIASHVVQSAEAKPVVPQQALGRMQNIINHLAA